MAAATGLDVLSHAVESYTALPFTERPRPERPILRPAYQGSNPISDIWSLEALRMVREYLPRAVEDPADDEARGSMLLAASYAGVGFGNAGVHLPHGMSYPVSSRVKTYEPPGYNVGKPLIPHGISVILNAPAVFSLYGAGVSPSVTWLPPKRWAPTCRELSRGTPANPRRSDRRFPCAVYAFPTV